MKALGCWKRRAALEWEGHQELAAVGLPFPALARIGAERRQHEHGAYQASARRAGCRTVWAGRSLVDMGDALLVKPDLVQEVRQFSDADIAEWGRHVHKRPGHSRRPAGGRRRTGRAMAWAARKSCRPPPPPARSRSRLAGAFPQADFHLDGLVGHGIEVVPVARAMQGMASGRPRPPGRWSFSRPAPKRWRTVHSPVHSGGPAGCRVKACFW